MVILLFALQGIGLQAQYEAGIRIGAANSAVLRSIPTSGRLFMQGNFGYRFFHQKRMSVMASVILEQSSYTMEDLTFGGLMTKNSITFRIAAAGIRIAPEIKLLSPEKSTNFYLMPQVGFRRVFSFTQIASAPEIDLTRHPSYGKGILIDGGLELGVKFNMFKTGIFYRTIVNRDAQNISDYTKTTCVGVGFSYFINRKTSE